LITIPIINTMDRCNICGILVIPSVKIISQGESNEEKFFCNLLERSLLGSAPIHLLDAEYINAHRVHRREV
jgi:hypothetical protein